MTVASPTGDPKFPPHNPQHPQPTALLLSIDTDYKRLPSEEYCEGPPKSAQSLGIWHWRQTRRSPVCNCFLNSLTSELVMGRVLVVQYVNAMDLGVASLQNRLTELKSFSKMRCTTSSRYVRSARSRSRHATLTQTGAGRQDKGSNLWFMFWKLIVLSTNHWIDRSSIIVRLLHWSFYA